MIGSLIFVLALAGDLTITETMSTNAGGTHNDVTRVTLLKDDRLRAETITPDGMRAVIYDLSSDKLILLDSKKHEATTRDLREVVAAAERTIPARKVQSSITPALRHKTIFNSTCDEYAIAVTVPVTSHDAMALHTTGTVCIRKDSPGADEYAYFAKRAIDQRLILSDGSDNRIIVAIDRAKTELYRRIVEIGFPYCIEVSFRFEGGGVLSTLLNSKSGGRALRVTAVSVEAIPDERFAIPAGWRIRRK